jgi:high-affinity Fe2+/Pb2+ permease
MIHLSLMKEFLSVLLIVLGYFSAVFYLVSRNRFLKEFYNQLNMIPAPGYGDSKAIFNIAAPLIFGFFFYKGIITQYDNSPSKKFFLIIWTIVLIVYFFIIYLPAIIRAKRKLR